MNNQISEKASKAARALLGTATVHPSEWSRRNATETLSRYYGGWEEAKLLASARDSRAYAASCGVDASQVFEVLVFAFGFRLWLEAPGRGDTGAHPQAPEDSSTDESLQRLIDTTTDILLTVEPPGGESPAPREPYPEEWIAALVVQRLAGNGVRATVPLLRMLTFPAESVQELASEALLAMKKTTRTQSSLVWPLSVLLGLELTHASPAASRLGRNQTAGGLRPRTFYTGH